MAAVPVNYWAILVCGIVSMVLGSVWYGPMFGKMFMQMVGMDKWSPGKKEEMKKEMMKSYTLTFIGSLVMAWVLTQAIIFAQSYMNTTWLNAGLMTGFISWLGFIATVSMGSVFWEGKSWKLWTLNNSYQLVQLLIFGAILGTWK
ncbi:MAG: DUF1761 domain-containing protein [Candidatus Doudnabacteria bacterium]